ncbi:MAG: glycosyltransferase, partial [Aeromonas sp.]
MPITINHVMSTEQKSKIFDDILNYFTKHSPTDIQHYESVRPLEGTLIRHYHRPQVEKSLIAPCVVTVHHDLEESDDWLSIDKFLPRYREANIVICLNTIQKDILASHDIYNTVVIPHGYNSRLIKPNLNSPRHRNGKIQIGIISRRYPRKVKGEAYILELLKRLDPEHFSFVLIGGDRLITSKYLQKMGFESTCFENAPYSVIADAYQTIDLLLMTSRYEGGPANIPEAVAAAVPIYCNPIGMAKDFVLHDVNGRHLSMDVDFDF